MATIEKIVWELFQSFKGLVITSEFRYGEKNIKSKRRVSSVYGYTQKTQRYEDEQEGLTVLNLKSSDYLIFRHVDFDWNTNKNEGTVLMSYPHLATFQSDLWELYDAICKCFKKDASDPSLVSLVDNTAFSIGPFHNDAYIMFEPVILVDEGSNGDDLSFTELAADKGYAAVRMYINSESHFVTCLLGRFKAFVNFYSNLDLFQMSQTAMTIMASQSRIPVGMGGQTSAKSPKRVEEPPRPNSEPTSVIRSTAAPKLRSSGLGRPR